MSEGDARGAAVDFVDVAKSYDGINKVVADLSLTIHAGELVTFLGPSGSGKTTTLMMLAGFQTTSEGEILLDGKPLNRLPPHKRGIGMLFQDYALFPHLTVVENVTYPLLARRIGRREARKLALDMLAKVELSEMADRYPAQLSGGQKQRVALARALVFEPKLVLLDEPLGALDKQLRERMQMEIRHLQQRLGVTMISVTHDQSEALTMSDRVAVFHNGRINQIAAPVDLYKNPVNVFVAGFIGESNLLEAVVESDNSGIAAVHLGNGVLARGRNVAAAKAGEKVSYLIRPEAFAISPVGEVGEAALTGRLTEAIYLGDYFKLQVAVPGLGELTVKSRIAFPVGEELGLSWSEEASRVLKDDN